jgi:hypothetical protein
MSVGVPWESYRARPVPDVFFEEGGDGLPGPPLCGSRAERAQAPPPLQHGHEDDQPPEVREVRGFHLLPEPSIELLAGTRLMSYPGQHRVCPPCALGSEPGVVFVQLHGSTDPFSCEDQFCNTAVLASPAFTVQVPFVLFPFVLLVRTPMCATEEVTPTPLSNTRSTPYPTPRTSDSVPAKQGAVRSSSVRRSGG